MARSRFQGKIVDILRAGEDTYVRAEVLGTTTELGCRGYRLRYVDNDREAFLPIDSIVEIQLAHQTQAIIKKFSPRLRALKPKQ